MSKIKQIAAFVFLVAIGSVQMLGDVMAIPELKALGAMLHVSPAPRVFTSQSGYETFSPKFYLHWHDNSGVNSMQLTPEVYQQVIGPYNRRNAYGAALSYGPVLVSKTETQALFSSVGHFAFCSDQSVLIELGVPVKQLIGPITLEIQQRDDINQMHDWQTEFVFNCEQTEEVI